MKVIFVDQLPAHSEGVYVHYYFRNLRVDGWEQLEIQNVIDQNIELWQGDVFDWHTSIGDRYKSDSAWWLLPGSRLLGWLPPVFQPLYYAMAIFKLLDSPVYHELYVVGAPSEVSLYLAEICPSWDIVGLCRVNRTHQLRVFLRSIASGSRFIFKALFLSVKNILVLSSHRIGKIDILVYSHLFSSEKYFRDGDHFFGNMFEGRDIDSSFVYFLENERHSIEALKHVQSKRKACGVYDLIGIDDAIHLLAFFAKVIFFNFKFKAPPVVLSGAVISSFSSRYENKLIRWIFPLQDYLLGRGVRKIALKSEPRVFIYPYEDKPLERAILSHLPDDTISVGFAHTAHHQGHLFLKQYPFREGLRPDFVASTGEGAMRWLESVAKIPNSSLLNIGTKRHHSVIPRSAELGQKVLFLVGQDYEVSMLATFIEDHPEFYRQVHLTIREHPHGGELQRAGVHRIEKIVKNVIVLDNVTLEHQVEESDFVLFSSTSAGVEAMLMGRVCIYVDLGHVIPLDPLAGKFDSSLSINCQNSIELKDQLAKLFEVTEVEYKLVSNLQINAACQIYGSINTEPIVSLR